MAKSKRDEYKENHPEGTPRMVAFDAGAALSSVGINAETVYAFLEALSHEQMLALKCHLPIEVKRQTGV